MATTFAGRYPIDNRSGEIERLHLQDVALASEAERMLDLIGVGEGWYCIDLGCGPGGITGQLSRRVGMTGHVVGVDMNPDFIEIARLEAPANLVFRQDDAYRTALQGATFDFVHTRFLASTAGAPERLLAEGRRLAKLGGIIALQEPDISTLNCYPPHPAWDKLKAAMLGAFRGVGADIELARRLYYAARLAGLEDVQYRPFIIGVRANDPLVDYLPSTTESLRRTIVELGLMIDEELTNTLLEARAHLSEPGTSFTMYTVAQVWGRNPAT